MFSLILVTTFTPFLWGDSQVSTKEFSGFDSMQSCIVASEKFVSYSNGDGNTRFYAHCVSKGETK